MLVPCQKYGIMSDEDARIHENLNAEEMITLFDLHKVVIEQLIEKINTCLSSKPEKWLKMLCDIVSSSNFQEVKSEREEFLVFEKICLCVEQEKCAGRYSVLFKLFSLEEVYELYYKTVFFIRRFEFGLADELCEEIIPYIKKWDLTPEFLIMVITGKDINNWNKTANRVSNFLLHHGYAEYGNLIIDWMLMRIVENS